ncbi:methyltransferase domain-containing protein [Prescottella subtropica]|uniref:methyltransferase domain-containing protein n=1 Tax=Prescottella subtropica TaxID=2545757 RepID=UPI0010F46856|nr:methyltransferase domain-containing protein [Prescottella subtropica]
MASTRDTVNSAVRALELVRDLGDESPVTTGQRAALQAWPGWGVLAPAFDPEPSGMWLDVADRLDSLLDEPARAAAADVVDTAFYTPPTVAAHLWQVLGAAGFGGGRVLDLGCGHGALMDAAPAGLPVEFTGVEVDPTSARIAALLHPSATIYTGRLQSTSLRDNHFDAVVANVPFSSVHVYDSAHEIHAPLHTYFLRRAVRAVRPGGYVVVIASRFVMDSGNSLREVCRDANLVAAMRLPTGTFTGTDVVADVLVFQVRGAGVPRSGWRDSVNYDHSRSVYGSTQVTDCRDVVDVPVTAGVAASPVRVNKYWAAYPEHVAGVMRVTGNRYNGLAVLADDPVAATAAMVAAVCATVPPITADPVPSVGWADLPVADAQGRKERSFHLVDGQVVTVTDGVLVQVPRPAKELRALISLRDAAVALMDLESDPDRPDEEISPTRAQALDLYTGYVASWGPLNRGTIVEGKPDPETGVPALSVRRPPMGGFRRDPDYSLVMALEEYNPDTREAKPAAVLLGRVNVRPPRVERVETAAEALAVTLGECGFLDLLRVASLLGVDGEDAAAAALEDLVYRDPQAAGAWTPARDYLSGNVRTKLVAAVAAAGRDSDYARNVTALEEVMPAQLDENDVRVNLGAPWLTVEDVAAFVRDELGANHVGGILHTPSIAYWELPKNLGCSAEARIMYGTAHMSPIDLLQCGLNGKRPIVYDSFYVDGKEKRVRNPNETASAADRLQALHERFSVWVFEDDTRRRRILDAYNERFSSHVTRRPDGSHLTVPGLSAGISLWPHQLDALDMALSRPRTLIGHAVGAGKTLEMVSLAIMLRRFGFVHRPCITVPKHLLEQIAREAQQAFPAARFLVATDDDLARDARRLFAARCATGNWDAVILTHEAFTSLGVDPRTEASWIEAQKAALRASMHDGPGRGHGAKQIARAVRSLEEKLSALRSKVADPDQITLEQLGIDYLAVDEADKFLRLPIATRADGFSLGSSKRATDMLMKVETLADRHPGRPVLAMFTGTPFRNTLAETYCWARLMIPDRLDALGLSHFDAFAATFIRWETRIEVAPDGSGFRTHTRPSTIQNLPELRRLLDEFADLLPADALGLARPDRREHTVVVEPSEQVLDYVAGLVARADALQGANTREPGSDNMLAICGDGRKIALDPALVGVGSQSPKLVAAADHITDVYRQNREAVYNNDTPGPLQLVLCDLGTPKPDDTSTYGRLRHLLIDRGVPADRIRFVHEATTAKSREALHAACRDGSVSVLIGSTPKVGIGTNIQTRLAAVHMVAPPWRPSDVEQGLGRAFRPGNLNEVVDVFTYVTERTFDAYSWEVLHRKARAFAHLYSPDPAVREIDDIGDATLAYAEIKAAASGNSLLLEEAEIKATARTLRLRKANHLRNQRAAEQQADMYAEEVRRLGRSLAAVRDLQQATATTAIPFDRVAESVRSLLARPYRRASLGPVTVSAETVHDTIVGFCVDFDHVQVASAPVSRAQLRRGVSALAPVVAVMLQDVDGVACEQHVTRLQETITRFRGQETASREAARSVFPDERALVAADARLAVIAAEIADSLAAESVDAQAA